MKEVPILFSTPMVKAILDGRKTQTRRILNPQPSDSWMENTRKFAPDGRMFDLKGKQVFWISDGTKLLGDYKTPKGEIKPKAKPGDLLWARETWRKSIAPDGETPAFYFRANDSNDGIGWKPSIHMPKVAARIWLRVTEVRVERLNEISENDAIAEGARFFKDLPLGPIHQRMITSEANRWSMESPENTDQCLFTAQMAFANIIEKVNGEGTWSNNPWVFAYTFEVLSTTGKPNENK